MRTADTTVRHQSCGGTVHFEHRRVPSQATRLDDTAVTVLVCDTCHAVITSNDQIVNGPVVGMSEAA